MIEKRRCSRPRIFLPGVVLAGLILLLLSAAPARSAPIVRAFADLGPASGAFKSAGEWFLVSDVFVNDGTAMFYNDSGTSVSGATIKANSTNLDAFDLLDMSFSPYTDLTLDALTVTGTLLGGGTVQATVGPQSLVAGTTYTLGGWGADLSGFTGVSELTFDIAVSGAGGQVYNLNFVDITIDNPLETASPGTTPGTQASALKVRAVGAEEVYLGWNNGNGSRRMVFAAPTTSGEPAVVDGTAYFADADFAAAADIGGGWRCVFKGLANEVLVSGLTPGTSYRFVVLELDGSGTGTVYLTDTGSNAVNQATTATFSGWTDGTVETLAAENFFAFTAAAGDDAGNGYAAYRFSELSNEVRLQKWDGSAWSLLGSLYPADGGYDGFSSGIDLSLAVAGVDDVHLALRAFIGTGSDNQRGIVYARYSGGTWSLAEVEFQSHPEGLRNFDNPLVALDDSGTPHILYEYSDENGDQFLKLASFDGSAWTVQTLATVADFGPGNRIRSDYLLLAGGGSLHVLYFLESAAGRELHYRSSGDGWIDTLLFAADGSEPSGLVGTVDPAGGIHIAHTAGTAGTEGLRYRTNAAGSWQTETILPEGDGSRPLALATNSGGAFAMPVFDGSRLRILSRQGNNPWQLTGTTSLATGDVDGGFGTVFGDDGRALVCYANAIGSRPRSVGYTLASLDLAAPPAVTGQPAAASVCAGGTADFSVTASGSGLNYRWQVDTGPGYSDLADSATYSGSGTATLTVSDVPGGFNGYRYRAVVTGDGGLVASDPALLSVALPPTVSAAPADTAVTAGEDATFSVAASGSVTGYQWQVDAGGGFADLAAGGAYSGTTSATLTVNGATTDMDGYLYRVVVGGTCAPDAVSSAATLTVTLPDADGDGIPDGTDECPSDPDNDLDNDGVCGDVDNCPGRANGDQYDSNGDGTGDACEVLDPVAMAGDFRLVNLHGEAAGADFDALFMNGTATMTLAADGSWSHDYLHLAYGQGAATAYGPAGPYSGSWSSFRDGHLELDGWYAIRNGRRTLLAWTPVPGHAGRDETGLGLALQPATGLGDADLNDEYHLVSVAARHEGADTGAAVSTALGAITFDGARGYSGAYSSAAQGQASDGPLTVGAFSGGYQLDTDGRLQLDTVATGYLAADRDVLVWTHAPGNVADEPTGLHVALKPATAADLGTLSGRYNLVGYRALQAGADTGALYSSGYGHLTFDGAGSFSGRIEAAADGQASGTALASGPVSGTYSVGTDGTLQLEGTFVEGGETWQMNGYVGPEGRMAAYAPVPGQSGVEATGLTLLMAADPGDLFPPATGASLAPDAASPAIAGASVSFTATAEGGSGRYEYRFFVKGPTDARATMVRDYSTDNTYSWTTPTSTGLYTVGVHVRNEGSTAHVETQKWISYHVVEESATAATLVPDLPSPQPSGAEVTLLAGASGGGGTYEFRFYLKGPGDDVATMVRDYSPDNTLVWTLPATTGYYYLGVHVRNQGSTAGVETQKWVTFRVVSAPVASATLAADSPSPQHSGVPVGFTASADGGSGSYEFRFYVKGPEDATATMVRDYSPDETFTWTPPATTGKYVIGVHVRNQGSPAGVEAQKWISCQVDPPMATSATLAADPGSPQPAGTSITFVAAAEGGSGLYEYRFYVKSPGDATATQVQGYSAENTFSWATPETAGNYAVGVHVRSQGSTASVEAQTWISFRVE